MTAAPRTLRLLPLFLLAAAVAIAPAALHVAALDPIGVTLLALLGGSALLGVAGARRIDLLLLAATLGALAFLTAIVHRSQLGGEPTPHPFYDWTFSRITAPELLTIAALLSALLRRALDRPIDRAPSPLRTGPVPWLTAALLALGLLVGLANGNSLEAATRDGRKIAYVVLAHLAILAVGDDPARRRVLIRTIAAALAAAAVVKIVDALADIGFHYNNFLRTSVDIADFLGFLALLYVPAALLRVAPGGPRRRLLLGALMLLGSAATLSTFSRAAWCAAPVGLAVVLAAPPGASERRSRLLLGLLLIGALAAPLLFSGVAERAFARIETLFDPNADPSVTYRVRELRGALEVAIDHPLAGLGFGTSFDAGAAILDRRRGSATLVHDCFLWVTLKAGLPGLLLFLGVLTTTGRKLRAAGRQQFAATDSDRAREAGLALGLLGVLAAFTTMGLVGAMLNQTRTAFLLGTITGLAQLLAGTPTPTEPRRRAA